MIDKLTPKEKAFADEYLETGNGVQSALKTYDTESYKTASNIASTNLDKPRVIEYLQSHAEEVAKNMYRLALSAESEQVQVSAGKDILDRAGFKPVDKSELIGDNLNAVLVKFIDDKDHRNPEGIS